MPAAIKPVAGQRFGNLITTGKWEIHHSHGDVLWECICGCGTSIMVRASVLRVGQLRGCRKCTSGIVHPKSGQIFGMWVTTGNDRVGRDSGKGSNNMWEVKCGCSLGKVKFINPTYLHNGASKNCGCTHSSPLVSAQNRIVYTCRANATKRGLENLLADDEILSMSQKPCKHCGAPSSNMIKRGIGKCLAVRYNGIDRLDNSIGYVSDNCVPCCKRCNFMKSTMGINEFHEHIAAIYQHSVLTDTLQNTIGS